MTNDEPTADDMAIGQRVRAWRGSRTQAELVREVNLAHLTQSTLSRVELGDRPLRLTEAVALADVLGVPLAALVDRDEQCEADARLSEVNELRQKIAAIREVLA